MIRCKKRNFYSCLGLKCRPFGAVLRCVYLKSVQGEVRVVRAGAYVGRVGAYVVRVGAYVVRVGAYVNMMVN